jgi:protein-tyrosine phosphatase
MDGRHIDRRQCGVGGVRCLDLEGAFNVRDLGGYPARDGRSVRWRRVFRADALHLLTDADAAVIEELGLRAIYDLRRHHERTTNPTRLPMHHGHRDVHLDVYDDPDALPGPDLLARLAAGQWTRRTDAEMTDGYVRMLVDGAAMFGLLLTALADESALPALFHCAAGKDRTGVAAALVLSVLGVERSMIIDDYAATNEYRTRRYIERVRPAYDAAGVDVEQIGDIIDARPTVLDQSLARIDATFGSVEDYLVDAAGVAQPTLDGLRRLLLE